MLAIYEMTIVSLETNTFAVFMILRIHFKNENNNIYFAIWKIIDAPGMQVSPNLQRHDALNFCKSRRFAPVFSRELLKKLRFCTKPGFFSKREAGAKNRITAAPASV